MSYNRPFNTRRGAPQSWLFNAEYPMLRWLEANGYDVSYFTGVDTRSQRRRDRQPQSVPVGRPRRVLVGRAARQRRGRARRRRPPRLLQRQRSAVEDALGDRASTARRRRAARWSATRKRSHNAKIDPDPSWTGTVARRALQSAVRWRASGKRADRHHLDGELLFVRDHGSARRWARTASGGTRASARCRPARSRRCRRTRSATNGTRI